MKALSVSMPAHSARGLKQERQICQCPCPGCRTSGNPLVQSPLITTHLQAVSLLSSVPWDNVSVCCYFLFFVLFLLFFAFSFFQFSQVVTCPVFGKAFGIDMTIYFIYTGAVLKWAFRWLPCYDSLIVLMRPCAFENPVTN